MMVAIVGQYISQTDSTCQAQNNGINKLDFYKRRAIHMPPAFGARKLFIQKGLFDRKVRQLRRCSKLPLDPRSSSIGLRRTKRLSPKSPSFPAARRWRDLQRSSCRHRNHHSGMDRNRQGTPPSHPRVAGPPSPERFSRTVPSTRQRKKQSQKPHGSVPLTTCCIRPTCVAPVRARRRFVPKRQLLARRRRKSWVRYGPKPADNHAKCRLSVQN